MPIIFSEDLGNKTKIGIWRIDEEMSELEKELKIDKEEEKFLNTVREKRKREWLASRLLLHKLSGRDIRGKVRKDPYGKPYLEQSSHEISVSHSDNLAAVIASIKPAGIDIQKHVDKISRIAPKFISETEFNYINSYFKTEYFHIIWGAKECIYKAYGRKSLDFKTHIEIKPFDYRPDGFYFKGYLNKEEKIKFILHGRKIEDYYLVYALEF